MDLAKEEHLLHAAHEGRLNIVIHLVDLGVNPNWRRFDGTTPLFAACQAGHLQVAQYLLQLPGIEPDIPNFEKATPLLAACAFKHVEVVSLLLGDPRVFPDPADREGCTPLYLACQEGCVGAVRLLLDDSRVNVNRVSNAGTSPFNSACQEGHLGVVEVMLEDLRVDVNRATDQGATPLYMAAQEGHLEIVRRILASGREVDTRRRMETEDPVENGRNAAEWARLLGSIQKPEWMEDEIHERAKVLGPTIADLIEAYEKDSVMTRHRIRQLPHLRSEDCSPFP